MCADCLKTGGFRACTYHMAERAVRLTQILLRIYDNQYLSSMTRARFLGKFFSQHINPEMIKVVFQLLCSAYFRFAETAGFIKIFLRFFTVILYPVSVNKQQSGIVTAGGIVQTAEFFIIYQRFLQILFNS